MIKHVKVLFVCGRNSRRSLTAEKIFKTEYGMSVRSAGLNDVSKHKIDEADIAWADLILVMERKNARRVQVAFSHLDSLPPIENLGIDDDYIFMHPKLVRLLREGVAEALEEFRAELEERK